MNKKYIVILLLLFVNSFAFSQKDDFSGKIDFTWEKFTDSTYYSYMIKNDLVTVTIFDKESDNVNFLIFDILNTKIIAVNTRRKLYKNITIKEYIKKNINEFIINKNNLDTIVNGYKCKKWEIINYKDSTKLTYFVNNSYNFKFYNDFLKLWSNTERLNIYWLQIDNSENYFPIKIIEESLRLSGGIKQILSTTSIKTDKNSYKFDDRSVDNLSDNDKLRYLNFINNYERIALSENLNFKQKEEIKQKEKQLELEKELKQKEIEQTRTQKYTLIGIITFVLLIIIVILYFYLQKRKANKLLSFQKNEISEKNDELNQLIEEVTAQRDEIEHQKDEIKDIHQEVEHSINYATKIQHSVFPNREILDKYLPNYFIFFKPKDKVSGDFYWWSHTENHTIITAADCTGHGVPGAFMSMLGISFLREIVQKEYITHPGVILRKLRKEVVKALKQTGESGTQKDGMDMSLISINKETNILQYAGANNPLYILTERNLQGFKNLEGLSNNDNTKLFYEIKPDKMPISIYDRMDKFTTHELQLEKGDIIYLFSDGFADQFGGPKGKKFKYKPFKKLILSIADKPMAEQNTILNNTFNDWIGDIEQVDDVTIIGIKI